MSSKGGKVAIVGPSNKDGVLWIYASLYKNQPL